jgi:hypothetical protein
LIKDFRMPSMQDYLVQLNSAPDWDAFLLAHSGLPGPRGNIELAQAAAELGDEGRFLAWLRLDPDQAPVNSPAEFLHFCGVLGLGKLVSQGQSQYLQRLRVLAGDPRWRTREAVAIALQRLGKADMDALLLTAGVWVDGNHFERRAAIAALAEPALLADPRFAEPVLNVLDAATYAIIQPQDRKDAGYQALRKGLAYAWSVVVAAYPPVGKPRMEVWLNNTNPEIHWIMKQNLGKKRLAAAGKEWLDNWWARFDLGVKGQGENHVP